MSFSRIANPQALVYTLATKVMSQQPTHVTLNSGYAMPVVGLGTGRAPEEQVYAAVKAAIEVGYRHFDCAYNYRNQDGIGQALRECFDAGLVNREELFITSKIWNTHHSKEACLQNADDILKQLGLDYVDLMLMHFPMGYLEGTGERYPFDDDRKYILPSDVDYLETWSAMEELVLASKAKSIGVSNFNTEQIDRLLGYAKITPAVNQVECSPYLPQKKLHAFCQLRGIGFTGFSSLGNPGSQFIDAKKAGNLLKDAVILAIAEVHGKSPAQVLLRWAVQRSIVVIPKSVNKARLVENMNIFDFVLSDAEMGRIGALDQGKEGRTLNMGAEVNHKYYPYWVE